VRKRKAEGHMIIFHIPKDFEINPNIRRIHIASKHSPRIEVPAKNLGML
jgi:hypothetical protein